MTLLTVYDSRYRLLVQLNGRLIVFTLSTAEMVKKTPRFLSFEKKSKGTFVGLKNLRQFFEISRLDATILI
jgi:hypothetical protein